MTDQDLMLLIKTERGSAIDQVCASSSVPADFLAALIANESGGHNDAKRFEPAVLSALWQVLLGRKAAYGSIGRADLVAHVADLSAPTATLPATIPIAALYNLDALAFSWGITQIMGYHCLEKDAAFERPEDLASADVALKSTVWLLGKFAAQFSLDVTADFSDLLHCWNAGSPGAPTYDSNYVPNALARMAIYKALP